MRAAPLATGLRLPRPSTTISRAPRGAVTWLHSVQNEVLHLGAVSSEPRPCEHRHAVTTCSSPEAPSTECEQAAQPARLRTWPFSHISVPLPAGFMPRPHTRHEGSMFATAAFCSGVERRSCRTESMDACGWS